jgi:hypothetical protein
MGYLSDVRILTTKKGYNELNKFVNEYMQKLNHEECNLMKNLDIKEENKFEIYFGWNEVKWYEGIYSNVDAIMNGLSDLEDKDYSFRYARLGERYDDYDESCYESDTEEQELEYPCLLRKFDDDYTIDCLITNDIDEDLTVE